MVTIENIECGTGQGFSKKESQQLASKNALKKIEQEQDLKNELIMKGQSLTKE